MALVLQCIVLSAGTPSLSQSRFLTLSFEPRMPRAMGRPVLPFLQGAGGADIAKLFKPVRCLPPSAMVSAKMDPIINNVGMNQLLEVQEGA